MPGNEDGGKSATMDVIEFRACLVISVRVRHDSAHPRSKRTYYYTAWAGDDFLGATDRFAEALLRHEGIRRFESF